jgi:hypothetical protein
MRYLHLIGQQHPNLRVDLKNVDRKLVTDCIYYADKYGSNAYLSNYKALNKLKRRLDTGEILLRDVPERLHGNDLLVYLESLRVRGQDTQKRNMHPNSMANLKTRAPFTSVDQPKKQCLVTEEQITIAKSLRDDGVSWRGIGDRLAVNYESVRSAMRRLGTRALIPSQNSSQKQGKNIRLI